MHRIGASRVLLQVFAGDAKGLRTGWTTARQGFRANTGVSDPAAIGRWREKIKFGLGYLVRTIMPRTAKLVAEAHDAADFLRQHIVQAKTNDAGRFGGSVLYVGSYPVFPPSSVAAPVRSLASV